RLMKPDGGRVPAGAEVIGTERLVLRRFTVADAAFVLQLLNDPSWRRHIGDRQVRTVEGAVDYLEKAPIAMYARRGFELYRVELRESGEPAGLCGLLKRDGLEDVDLGFALRPKFWSQGYAFEAATATMAYARSALGLSRLLAIASPDNDRSAKLLDRLGFRFERLMRLAPAAPELKLYVSTPARA